MRSLAAATAALAAALPMAVAPPRAVAASDCQVAFQKWALLSDARVRTVVRSAGGGQGACLPSEDVRRSLLEALARTRRLCGDSLSNPGTQQTRTLLNINHSFISSLGICPSESRDGGPGWATRAAPAAPSPPADPVVAAPSPPPEPPPKAQPEPPPVRAAPKPAPPRPGGPRPATIAQPNVPPPKPKPKAAAAPLPEPPCLEVSSAEAGRYAFVNEGCRGHAVIAVIETRNPYGKLACRGYTINRSLALSASGNTPPRLNYECVAGGRRCNKTRLGNMFPECEW